MSYIFIGLGGALGALARYKIGIWLNAKWNTSFPMGTFVINLTGAFLLGIISSLVLNKYSIPKDLGLFVTTGFLGGYTTFSTFIYENLKLVEKGMGWQACKYILFSNLFGILGAFLGVKIGSLI